MVRKYDRTAKVLRWTVELSRAAVFVVAAWAVGHLVFETWLDWV